MKPEASAARMSPARLISYVALAGASLLIAWAVVRTSAVAALLSGNSPMAASVSPHHPEAVMERALLEFRARGRVSEETLAKVIDAAERAPTADVPVFLHGTHLLTGSDRASAQEFLEEARRRNPRSRLPRLLLLDHYLRAGKSDEAAAEIAALARLIPSAAEILIPELVRLARDPAARPALKRALGSEPMMDRVLEELVDRKASPALILDLAEGRTAAGDGSALPAWASKLVVALVERGEVDDALRVWSGLTGLEASGEGLVRDPEFRDLPGAPPFDWQLVEGPSGFSEFRPGGSLYTEYYGRENMHLARQMLNLAPGRYRLAVEATDSGGAEGGGKIQLSLTCLGSDGTLAQILVAGGGDGARPGGTDFQVPSGCAAQWLSLEGRSAEFPKTHSATVQRVSVERIGASR